MYTDAWPSGGGRRTSRAPPSRPCVTSSFRSSPTISATPCPGSAEGSQRRWSAPAVWKEAGTLAAETAEVFWVIRWLGAMGVSLPDLGSDWWGGWARVGACWEWFHINCRVGTLKNRFFFSKPVWKKRFFSKGFYGFQLEISVELIKCRFVITTFLIRKLLFF